MDRLEGLPVIDVDKGEDIQVAVRADDLIEGNMIQNSTRLPLSYDASGTSMMHGRPRTRR